jgi:hypothetical protein
VSNKPIQSTTIAPNPAGTMQIPALIIFCLLLDIGLGLAYLGNYIAGQPFYPKITDILNLDGEDSLSAWYSSTKFFCVGVLGLIYAVEKYDRKSFPTLLLFGLPAIFLFFSIDEAVQIHEWLGVKSDHFLPHGTRKATYFDQTGIWMFLFGVPFLIAFLWLIFLIRKHFTENSGSFKKVAVGMLILLAGAIGIETITNFVPYDTIWDTLQVLFEELLEMLGATVIFWGMYEMTIEYLPYKQLRHSGN